MRDTSPGLCGTGAIALMLATLLVAGCPAAKGTGPLGGACKTGADCASGDCDTSIAGGYCSQVCGVGGACPSGSACAASPAGKMECLVSCMTTNQCPVGDLCTNQTCIPPSSPVTGCTDSNVCPSGYTCNTSSGDCVQGALTNVGAQCSADTDCTGGNQPQCETAAQNFPDGYCTAVCTEASDCGSGGECVAGFSDANGNPISECLQKCTQNSDCRTDGYQCQDQDGTYYCYPQDCRSNPLSCTVAQTCDTSTGICQSRLSAPGYPATFPKLPQVQFGGGPVLANPEIVAVYFANDDMTVVPQLEEFYSGIGASVYWNALQEYGVGAATATNIILDGGAPTSIDDSASFTGNSDLQNWLLGEIDAGVLPPPDGNTEYMINYPDGTTITEGGGSSCSSFGGYHADLDDNGTNLAYGVIPRCPAEGTGFTTLQLLTGSASHEIVEAATDPYPNLDPAYSFCDTSHIFYDEANDGSELGDMCENDPEAFYQYLDFPFVVQRIWSNRSAAAGHDPCQPDYTGEVYFNAAPLLPDSINFDFYGQTVSVVGKHIPVGGSDTITLELYSDYPINAWSVQLYDFNYFQTGSMSGDLLSFTPMPPTTGKNGSTQTWTVKVNSAGNMNTNGQVNNTELFAVLSQSGSGPDAYVHLTWGLIGN